MSADTPIEIDLHGKTCEEAARILRAALRESHAERRKDLIVVHGRGWRSQGKAVLPRFVRDWLMRLEQHPRSPIQRLLFGEQDTRVRNPGRVLVELKLHRANPAFDPDAPARPPRKSAPPIPTVDEVDIPAELLEESEEELRRWMEEGG